jgi:hypothetical protein
MLQRSNPEKKKKFKYLTLVQTILNLFGTGLLWGWAAYRIIVTSHVITTATFSKSKL